MESEIVYHRDRGACTVVGQYSTHYCLLQNGEKFDAGLQLVRSTPWNNASIAFLSQANQSALSPSPNTPQLNINDPQLTIAQLSRSASGMGRSYAKTILANRPPDGYMGYDDMKTRNPDVEPGLFEALRQSGAIIFSAG